MLLPDSDSAVRPVRSPKYDGMTPLNKLFAQLILVTVEPEHVTPLKLQQLVVLAAGGFNAALPFIEIHNAFVIWQFVNILAEQLEAKE